MVSFFFQLITLIEENKKWKNFKDIPLKTSTERETKKRNDKIELRDITMQLCCG
jgi:hypothetical protein